MYNETKTTCLYHKYFFTHIINGSVYVRMYITTFIIKAGILARGDHLIWRSLASPR